MTISSVPVHVLCPTILLIFLIFLSSSFSFSIHELNLSLSTYEFIVAKVPSRMAVFFAFNVFIIAIFRVMSFNNPSTEDFDCLIFSFPHIHEDQEGRAQDDHEATTWADYDNDDDDQMSDIDDSDECHGYDGYDEDNDDDGSDDDDLDSEDDHEHHYRDLEKRSNEFIARNYMQRRRDELIIYWGSFFQEPNPIS
ncbi:hypothetical protein I3843_01G253900 [Carya illinoinensis]|nr:hypothetical protein I3843_01G253900 [Carya illinoinensis]